jgi:hypothetical protein
MVVQTRFFSCRLSISHVKQHPLVEPPAPGDAYGVILLNSNARSHFALTNAIGVVGPSQLKELRLILQNSWHPGLFCSITRLLNIRGFDPLA